MLPNSRYPCVLSTVVTDLLPAARYSGGPVTTSPNYLQANAELMVNNISFLFFPFFFFFIFHFFEGSGEKCHQQGET